MIASIDKTVMPHCEAAQRGYLQRLGSPASATRNGNE